MKRIMTWILLLNKRLLKKGSYIAMLLLIPLAVALFYGATKEPAGMVTVLLSQESSRDQVSAQLIQQLLEEPGVILFAQTTPENAVQQVAAGKADAAWIFPADTGKCLENYIAGEQKHFVRVVEREQTVPLRLARERLNGAIYSLTVEEVFLDTIHRLAPETEQMQDAELLSYLDKTHVNGELFAFYDVDGNLREVSGEYLTAPLRGMLAVLAAVCAMVTGMYYQKDFDQGVFSLLPKRYHTLTELGYHMISVIHIVLISLLALVFCGLAVHILRELLLLVLYSLACCLFVMVLRSWAGGSRGLAALIPVLTVLMLVICPVFVDIPGVQEVRYLLPPSYYILGAYSRQDLLMLAGYILVLLLLLLFKRGIDKMKWSKMKIL